MHTNICSIRHNMISDKNEKVNAKRNKVGSLEKFVIKNGL